MHANVADNGAPPASGEKAKTCFDGTNPPMVEESVRDHYICTSGGSSPSSSPSHYRFRLPRLAPLSQIGTDTLTAVI